MDAAKLRSVLPGVPLIESPFFDEILPSGGIDLDTALIAKELNKKGFVILRFPDDNLTDRAARIKQNLSPHFDFERWRTHGWKQNDRLRLHNTWRFDEDVRAIAVNPRILKILSDVFGRKAWPFSTLNFPVGTQQHFQSDCVHFSSMPERFMCGVWVALEDVSEDAGPLECYPSTHKWPIIYNDQIGLRITRSNGQARQELYHDVWEALVEKHGILRNIFLPAKVKRSFGPLIYTAAAASAIRNATRWS